MIAKYLFVNGHANLFPLGLFHSDIENCLSMFPLRHLKVLKENLNSCGNARQISFFPFSHVIKLTHDSITLWEE